MADSQLECRLPLANISRPKHLQNISKILCPPDPIPNPGTTCVMSHFPALFHVQVPHGPLITPLRLPPLSRYLYVALMAEGSAVFWIEYTSVIEYRNDVVHFNPVLISDV